MCSAACFAAARNKRISTKAPPSDIPPATRSSVLARDGERCRFCGTTTDLHEHHIRYRSEGVDHTDTNLITLCARHHQVVHSDKARWQPVCMVYIAEVVAGRHRYLVELDREINGGRPQRLPCSNCGAPIAGHCTVHLVPCCPGKCPDLAQGPQHGPDVPA